MRAQPCPGWARRDLLQGTQSEVEAQMPTEHPLTCRAPESPHPGPAGPSLDMETWGGEVGLPGAVDFSLAPLPPPAPDLYPLSGGRCVRQSPVS